MTRVYALKCEALYENAALQRALPLLDEARVNRIRRLLHPQKRAQCAAAGLLLRHLFGACTTVAYTKTGKPYLPDKPGTHFNLSHTGGWVFCAVSDAPVGIDAQKLTPYKERLAKRWFPQQERQWLLVDPDARFTRLWTQKEAYAKMTGDGLVKTIMDAEETPHAIKEYPDLVGDGIYITVCVAGDTAFSGGIEIVKGPLW